MNSQNMAIIRHLADLPLIILWCLLKVKTRELYELEIMVNEGLSIVALLTSRCSYHILLALNIADGNDNVLHDGYLRVHVMSTFYNRESILIVVDGLILLRCHEVISIYILLGISNLDVGMTQQSPEKNYPVTPSEEHITVCLTSPHQKI